MGLNFSSSKSSRAPRALRSSGRQQAISWPLERAVGASVCPQSDPEEKEGPFVSMEEEKKPDVDVEPSPWREVQAPELHLWEEAARRELDVLAQWRQKGLLRELCQEKKVTSAPQLAQEKQAHCPASSEEVPSAGAQSPGPALRSSSCPPRISLSPLRIPADVTSYDTSVWSDEDWECHIQPELRESHRETSGSRDTLSDLCDWDNCLEPEPCWEEVRSWDSTSQDLQVSSEEDSSDFTDVSCDSELSVSSFGLAPLAREEDEWDKRSILGLDEEGGRAQSTAAVAGGLKGRVPGEAWGEAQEAPESLHASPPSLKDQGSVGQQGPEAGPAAPSKRPGRLRRALRALRGLCRCPCLRAQTQE